MRFAVPLAGGLALLLPIAGCLTRPDPAEPPTPFVLRSLNLREQDRQGRPAWTVTSPEARYDINRRMATGVSPVAVIFAAGVPLYEMKAERATVINDGDVIQLEGSVSIRRLGDRPVQVQSGRLRWYPARSWIDLDLQPRIREGLSVIRADKASFNLSTEVVQLRGSPVLERWASQAGMATTPALLALRVSRAEWSLRSGAWSASGPVLGQRRVPGQGAAQNLEASAMRGNSRQQSLDLLAPVILTDPSQQTRIRAQLTHVDLAAQTIASDQPLQASIGDLEVQGNRFRVDLSQTEALITDQCRIRQPGVQLQAGRCRWNWVSRRIWADDGVVLQRAAGGQITRSQALSGRLGSGGQVMVFTPGGRVQSQIQLRDRGPGPQRRPPAIVP